MTYYTNDKQVLRKIDGDDPSERGQHIADAASNEDASNIATRLNEYQSSQYMADADKTNSTIFKPEQVDALELRGIAQMIADEANRLDVLKKLLVRGKSLEDMGKGKPIRSLAEALPEFGPHEVNVIHGVIGALTEAGELAEVLIRWLDTGKLDAVNVVEECGDLLWYIVRALRGCDVTLAECMTANVDKLHGRHGDSFNVFRDAHRDLDTERARLERATAKPRGKVRKRRRSRNRNNDVHDTVDGMKRTGRAVPGTEGSTLGAGDDA